MVREHVKKNCILSELSKLQVFFLLEINNKNVLEQKNMQKYCVTLLHSCKDIYHILDMILVALPPLVAGDGPEEHSSYFV